MKNSQNTLIKKALENGQKLTSLSALRDFGCLRLASRISDLRRMGVPVIVTTRCENGKHFAEYSINNKKD